MGPFLILDSRGGGCDALGWVFSFFLYITTVLVHGITVSLNLGWGGLARLFPASFWLLFLL